jgi:putative resolvase
VPKAGHLFLVFPQTATVAAGKTGGAGLYAGHRDWLGRVNTELAEVALSADFCRPVVPGNCGLIGDLVRGMAGVLTWFCARLYGRRSARDRVLKAVGCARQGVGPRAVGLQGWRGGV